MAFYNIFWEGTPTLNIVHNGGGSLTFTLTGGKAYYYFGSDKSEAAYEVVSNNKTVCYLMTTQTPYYNTETEPPGTRTYTCRAYVSMSGDVSYSTSGNPSRSFNVPAPVLSWSNGAKLIAQAEGNDLRLTVDGTASMSNGYSGTIYYPLYYGDLEFAPYNTNTSVVIANGTLYTEYPFKIRGWFSVWNRYTESHEDYYTPYLIVYAGNYVAYYDGSGWKACEVYYYNGSSWVLCVPYYYNGSSWVEISYNL